MQYERERWIAAWHAVGAPPPPGLLAKLVDQYSAADRAYHTLQHLGECFTAADAVRHLAERPAEIELAIWFHDAIYDTHAGDNEEQSASWAMGALAAVGVPEPVPTRVGELILDTKHTAAVPADTDARLLVDLDLGILGSAPARYAEYEEQVRKEYAWVSEVAYRNGRSKVLRMFLDRPAIYSTTWFEERLEAKARANLEQSLRALDA